MVLSGWVFTFGSRYDLFDFGEGFIIRYRLQTTYSQQKSYVNHRRRELEFKEGDKLYLKILPMKGVDRFGKKGKLSPRYVGPYWILQGCGKVAYELRLHSELASIYSVFHVSLLKKFGDPEFVLPIEGLGVKYNIH